MCENTELEIMTELELSSPVEDEITAELILADAINEIVELLAPTGGQFQDFDAR